MSEHHQEASARHDPSRLPRHTTPTWEVELLISGVAVFAMLQLPGWLNDHVLALMSRFEQDWRMPLLLTYGYAEVASVILAATFTLHLLLRAQWIALVGMHSVFPDGVRWDMLRIGPVQRERLERQAGDADAMIDRADNRSTIVFAVGVMLATRLLIISVLVVILTALVLGALALAGLWVSPQTVFTACIYLMLVPLLLGVIDRRLGHRLRAGGPGRRMLNAGLTLFGRLGLGRDNSVMALLSSNRGPLRTQLLTMLAVFAAVTLAIAGVALGNWQRSIGSFGLFPAYADDSGQRLNPRFYLDTRDPGRGDPVPYIQSMIISDPYLRLVVPYQPVRDAPAMRRTCPAVEASANEGTGARARLDCLARLHAVALDGQPLKDLRFDTGAAADQDRPALIAMIDTRNLAPGRHALRVLRPAAQDADDPEQPDAFVIPFWR